MRQKLEETCWHLRNLEISQYWYWGTRMSLRNSDHHRPEGKDRQTWRLTNICGGLMGRRIVPLRLFYHVLPHWLQDAPPPFYIHTFAHKNTSLRSSWYFLSRCFTPWKNKLWTKPRRGGSFTIWARSFLRLAISKAGGYTGNVASNFRDAHDTCTEVIGMAHWKLFSI